MECEWKKIKLLSLFFTFKGLRHVKTLNFFFIQRWYSVASQTSNKTFFEKKKHV